MKLTASPKKYDACDCPNCGRQIILGVRYDRSEAMVIPECLMEEVYEKIEEDGINEQNMRDMQTRELGQRRREPDL